MTGSPPGRIEGFVADEESAAAPVGRITPGETDVKLHHEGCGR
jgi:hypothetical protein